MKRIGVILSGCGVKDGSEIHEATLTLYYIYAKGAEAVCMSPDAPQAAVVDHRTGKETGEKRNMLTEAARIARGEILPLESVKEADLDGLLLPGGFGAAMNLCTYAQKGRQMEVRADVASLLEAVHRAGKPIGAICIAPVLVAAVFGRMGIPVEVTVGNDASVAADIESFGARHVEKPVHEAHVDEAHKIATAPAYMLGQNIAEIAPGIEKVVEAVLRMAS